MSDKVIIPCPYCGGYAKLECQHGQYVVFCISTRCLVEPCTPYYNTPEEAIEAWNSRVSPSPVTPERLAELLLQCGLTPFSYMPSTIVSNSDEWDHFRLNLSSALLDKLDIREKENKINPIEIEKKLEQDFNDGIESIISQQAKEA